MADGVDYTPKTNTNGTGGVAPGRVPWKVVKDNTGQTVVLPATRDQVNAQLRAWFNGDTTDDMTWTTLAKRLDAGGYNNNGSWSSVKKAWDTLLNETLAVGGSMTVYDYLGQQIEAVRGFKAATAGPGSAGPYMGPTTQVTLTNETDAHSILDNALQQYLGRAATSQERDRFVQQLNKAEKANPRVSDPTGLHSSVSSGGVNQQQLAEDFATKQPEFAQTQASTTLNSWLDTAIKSLETERLVP